jgi:hypothetical protein
MVGPATVADSWASVTARRRRTTTTADAVRLRWADLTFAEAPRRLAAGARYLDGDGIARERDGAGGLPSMGGSVGAHHVAAGVAVLAGTGACARPWRTGSAGRRPVSVGGVSIRSSLRQRLGASVAELDRTRLQDRCRGLDVTPIGEAPRRVPVRVGGEVKRVIVAPRNGVPNLEVMIHDGTGTITAVFAGRRRIAGIDHGRAIVLEGVPVDLGDRAVIYNPAYTLVP